MLPVIPVVLPLFGAALLAALTKAIPQRVSQTLAITVTLATLGDVVYLLRASAAQPIVYWFGAWHPRQGLALGISFVVDPIGAGLAGLATVLTLAALIFSSRYFDDVGNHFPALLLGFLGALCGFSLTGDMFNMFVFFELMSAAAFALCGYKTDDPGSLQGAFNFGLTNTVAAYFVLTGIGLLYARTGALNMAQMGNALGAGPLDSLVLVGFVFVVFGYLVKGAVIPFHFWLADAHAVAPTPVCILLSGVMVEMGVFALARTYWAVFSSTLGVHRNSAMHLFVTVGVITAFLGALMCYLQRNLKRLLAFSTISHVGVMLVGIALFTPTGLAGAAVYALGHGMVKASLFLVAGILLHRFRAIDEQDLQGRGCREWWTAGVFFLGAFGLAGIPISGLAAGNDLMNVAAKAMNLQWLRWIFVMADAVTAAAVLRAGGRIFCGWGALEPTGNRAKQEEKPETKGGHQHTPPTMFVPAAALVIAGLTLGLFPNLKRVTVTASASFENTHAYAARVLESVPYPAPPQPGRVPFEVFDGLLATAAAISIAAFDLFSGQAGRISGALRRPIEILHELHSGHVGDYIAFLTFGLACFGLICVYWLR